MYPGLLHALVEARVRRGTVAAVVSVSHFRLPPRPFGHAFERIYQQGGRMGCLLLCRAIKVALPPPQRNGGLVSIRTRLNYCTMDNMSDRMPHPAQCAANLTSLAPVRGATDAPEEVIPLPIKRLRQT